MLDHLEQLDKHLQTRLDLDARTSHALIGKYVFLRYLRDRGILSDHKLDEWGLDQSAVFKRNATLTAFWSLVDHLDEWLNGSVFPLPPGMRSRVRSDHLRLVAGVFFGDSPDGQLHLDFDAYDFSFIPIETLSVIYEQFLHSSETSEGVSAGRERGAYYTPIPLVNYVLHEMGRQKPFREGMRVLDPACGSGAFLVQCYRKLIEQAVAREHPNRPRPTQLRDLLTRHVFGIDNDGDACQVAELSLALTLLDYVEPPDLSGTNFKLPALRNRNIFCCDAFDDSALDGRKHQHAYDWVVGNPPWKEVKSSSGKEDQILRDWIARNKDRLPTGGNQVAEAFAWRAMDFVAPDGAVGLLLPAMTLFKKESVPFRRKFFESVKLGHVANFSNLAEVLFSGRSRVPAAAFFYSPSDEDSDRRDWTVEVYSPLVANQEANRPVKSNRRQDTWSLVVNASEIRSIPYRDVMDGDILPWKLATWGSSWDLRLLRAVSKRFPTLGDLEKTIPLTISEGLQLRRQHAVQSEESLEHHPELAGKHRLNVEPLKRLRNVFQFPKEAIEKVPPEETFVRARRFDLPYSVCQPPHVIVSAARNFAVFTDEFLIVPPRQIGIAGPPSSKALLKAITAYLNSDFAKYHQFLVSPQFGVKRTLATLDSLRRLPVPFSPDTTGPIETLSRVYDEIARQSARTESKQDSGLTLFDQRTEDSDFNTQLEDLNEQVSEYLQLDDRARAQVRDLVHVRIALDDGKIGKAAADPPSHEQMSDYGRSLQHELDGFINATNEIHRVRILADDKSGLVQVCLVKKDRGPEQIEVLKANSNASRQLQQARDRLRERHAQWLYFDRSLRIYEGSCTYLLKPMQRVHWTQSHALVDADEIIADTLRYTGE